MIKTDNILTDALSEALETMAFLMITPMDDDLEIPQNTVLAEIDFTGSQKGNVQILASLEFGKILAQNIAALDQVGNETSYDALKEFANVVCGLILHRITSSPADEFDVTIPFVRTDDDSSPWDEFTAEKNCSILNIEGHAIAAKLTIENKAIITESN